MQSATILKEITLVCENKAAEEICRPVSRVDVGVTSLRGALNSRKSENLLLVGDCFSDKSLTRALKPPYIGCFETGPDNSTLESLVLPWVLHGGIALAISTATAFSCDLTRLLCQSVADRIGLIDEQLVDMEIAIQEAIANGLVHGNLGIDSSMRGSLETFDDHCRLTEDRLSDPKYNQRRLFFFVRWDAKGVKFTIRDEGSGYDTCMTDVRYSGRGLKLITELTESVSSTDNGRSITLRFSR